MDFGIIAAGSGSRLAARGITEPKPLVAPGGVPMIRRLIDIMTGVGATSVTVIIREGDQLTAHYLEELRRAAGVPLRIESRATRCSLHSFAELVRAMRPSGRFVVTTVDTLFSADSFSRYLERFIAASGIDGLLGVTQHVDDENPVYLRCGDGMRIEDIFSRDEGDSRYVSAGVYGLDAGSVPVLERCVSGGMERMRDFQRALVRAGLHLEGYDMGRVLDIDRVEDLASAEAFLRSSEMV